MTDRVQSLTVILDRDIRKDDVQVIISAILQLRHVAAVTPGIVTGGDLATRTVVTARLEGRAHAALRAVFREEAETE